MPFQLPIALPADMLAQGRHWRSFPVILRTKRFHETPDLGGPAQSRHDEAKLMPHQDSLFAEVFAGLPLPTQAGN